MMHRHSEKNFTNLEKVGWAGGQKKGVHQKGGDLEKGAGDPW